MVCVLIIIQTTNCFWGIKYITAFSQFPIFKIEVVFSNPIFMYDLWWKKKKEELHFNKGIYTVYLASELNKESILFFTNFN